MAPPSSPSSPIGADPFLSIFLSPTAMPSASASLSRALLRATRTASRPPTSQFSSADAAARLPMLGARTSQPQSGPATMTAAAKARAAPAHPPQTISAVIVRRTVLVVPVARPDAVAPLADKAIQAPQDQTERTEHSMAVSFIPLWRVI